MKEFVIKSIEDLTGVGDYLSSLMRDYNIFLMRGPLGAGKTTLVKSWLSSLGVNDKITSPTFSLVNHYKLMNKDIYHIDLYRLKTVDEVLNIGMEEYLDDSKAICIIEWPELSTPLLGNGFVDVEINRENLNRRISISTTS